MIRCLAALSIIPLLATQVMACSAETACSVGDRDYYIELPTSDEPKGAVIYMHGWGGSGKGALRNRRMVDGFLERGFAVIAPDGVRREGRNGRTWRFHPATGEQQNEVAFLAEVKADAVSRFDLNPDEFILGGFSIGGSMTAYAACLGPDNFAAFVPIGGNFWRPHPDRCEGPVKMLHTHGWTDTTVPLEGRVVNGVPITDPDAFAQGDIFQALQIWRETNGCVHLRADRFVTDGPFLRRAWERCDADTTLELAVFPGGHTIPNGWPDLVINWYESL